jgi:CheY-like chemotaxis protein
MPHELKRILLAEDNANDLELTLAVPRANRLANEVIVVRDGAEALEWLFRRGQFADRDEDLPAFVLLDLKMPKVDGLEALRQIKRNHTRGAARRPKGCTRGYSLVCTFSVD